MATNPASFSTDFHGWAELLPVRQPQPALVGTHRTKWVVVGAGFTGLASARRLAQLHRDDEILLIDARSVGQGASGRNSGFAVAVSDFPVGIKPNENNAALTDYLRINRINQAGLDILRQQVSEHNIDCQWDENGFYRVAADQLAMTECKRFLALFEKLEIPHTELNKESLADKLGTKLYQSGVHVTNGALLQPASLVYGLAETLPSNVTLYERNPVLGLTGEHPVTLQLENGSVIADNVILATNYEAGKLGFLSRRLIGSTLSGSFTRVLNQQELDSLGNLNQWGVLSLHGGGATVRLTNDHRICIRNTAEFFDGKLLSEKLLKQRATFHRQHFLKRFPQLENVPFEFSWSGVEGISRNGTNFFGRQRGNIFLAGGYNGSGVTKGTAFGKALAEYASGETSDLIEDCLCSEPASWIPPRPFLDIGAAYTVQSRFKGVGLDR